MSNSKDIKLGIAATLYLASLSREESEASRQEIYKFVRWYSEGKLISELLPSEVASYAEQVSSANTDYSKKLASVKNLLLYAKKEGWIKDNLAVHLKARKTKNRVKATGRQVLPKIISLTQEGYDAMKAELEVLKKRQLEVIDEIHRAAADKDLKENAPYHAAREQKGYIDGKIMELEETLKTAVVVVVGQNNTSKAGIGDTVVLRDSSTGEAMHYTLVSPREVDPSRGKISSSSPIGKAVMGHRQGEAIEITVPAGKIRYEIKQVSH